MAKEWNTRRVAPQTSPEALKDFEAWKAERADLLKSVTGVRSSDFSTFVSLADFSGIIADDIGVQEMADGVRDAKR